MPLHLRTCDVIVATSRRIRTELETLHGGQLDSVLVKPNTIDTSTFAVKGRPGRTAGEALRLLCVSRIDPKKGIEYLIEAVRVLIDRGIAVEAHIVGAANLHSPESIEYGNALRARAARLGLDNTIHFEGQRDSREQPS